MIYGPWYYWYGMCRIGTLFYYDDTMQDDCRILQWNFNDYPVALFKVKRKFT